MKEKDVLRGVVRSSQCSRRCSQEGFNRTHISRMEMGDIDPKLTALPKYAKSLHVQLSVLIGELTCSLTELTPKSKPRHCRVEFSWPPQQAPLIVPTSCSSRPIISRHHGDITSARLWWMASRHNSSFRYRTSINVTECLEGLAVNPTGTA